MSSPNQPQQIILNSKFRASNEEVNSVQYNLTTPIHDAVGCRITSFSTVYLIKLIQPSQALLQFDISTNADLFTYNISLSSIQNNYYQTLNELLVDLNAILDTSFNDPNTTSQFYTGIKPTIVFDSKKLKIQFVANQSQVTTFVSINSNNNNLWFKLGFPNAIYSLTQTQLSPQSPSIIPLNEIYVLIDGLINETATIKLNNNVDSGAVNNQKIAEIITFNNVSLGDIFYWRGNNVPEYPLRTSPCITSFNIKLINSLGEPVQLDSNYRIQLDFIY